MNHDDALRLLAAERYLLRNLDADLRDPFEAHFFECIDCANDVRSAWTLPITALQAKDTLSIEMPELQAGTYTLVIEGLASGAKPIAVERQRFHIYSHN